MRGDTRAIHQRLAQLLQNAHAPYSQFRVAAAAVDEAGNVHYGVNVENQSFPVGTCAEAGAIAALRTAGGKRIAEIYLLSEPNIAVLPCGACRQRLAELGGADIPVITFGPGGEPSAYSLNDIFPHSFRFRDQESG